MFRKMQNRKGFSLVEMLAVIAIIAILVAVVVPTVTNAVTKSKGATDAANLRSLSATIATIYTSAELADKEGDYSSVEAPKSELVEGSYIIVYKLGSEVQSFYTETLSASRKLRGVPYNTIVAETGKIHANYDQPDGEVICILAPGAGTEGVLPAHSSEVYESLKNTLSTVFGNTYESTLETAANEYLANLKATVEAGAPNRSDYPSGIAGGIAYRLALADYNNKVEELNKLNNKVTEDTTLEEVVYNDFANNDFISGGAAVTGGLAAGSAGYNELAEAIKNYTDLGGNGEELSDAVVDSAVKDAVKDLETQYGIDLDEEYLAELVKNLT